MAALDKKASELDPPADAAACGWAGYELIDGVPTDVQMSVALIRPGVSAYGVRIALGATDLQTVANAIPADITDAVTIRWQGAARVQAGDALHAFIKATLSKTDPEMAALMNAAAAYE